MVSQLQLVSLANLLLIKASIKDQMLSTGLSLVHRGLIKIDGDSHSKILEFS